MGSLVALLQPGQELPADLLKAVLAVLLGLAHDRASCDAVQQASGIPKIIKLLEYAGDEQVRQQAALNTVTSPCPVATLQVHLRLRIALHEHGARMVCQDCMLSRLVTVVVPGPVSESPPKSCIAFRAIYDLYMLKGSAVCIWCQNCVSHCPSFSPFTTLDMLSWQIRYGKF